jgi:hypothetical protein
MSAGMGLDEGKKPYPQAVMPWGQDRGSIPALIFLLNNIPICGILF